MNEVWKIERSLWLEGVEAYQTAMAKDCIMAFGSMGAMQNDAIVESLKDAPRWAEVTMTQQTTAQPADDVTVISYKAKGTRPKGDAYLALCTSTYLRTLDGWKIAQHQQTPI